jgi:hypothetical protein
MKRQMSYKAASPSPTPAPSPPKAAAAAAPKASFAVSTTSFSNAAPAEPSRTTAHAPAAQPVGASSAEDENARRRAQGQATVAGTPSWVKDAKNQQERNDFVAAKEWMEAVTVSFIL